MRKRGLAIGAFLIVLFTATGFVILLPSQKARRRGGWDQYL